MSFYTGVVFYRPTPPPQITTDRLSRFIQTIIQADVLDDRPIGFLEVKYGSSIDADDNGTSWEEELGSGISAWKEIDWDLQMSGKISPSEMVTALKADSRSIYRADVILGTLRQDIYEKISRLNTPENAVNFTPYDLSLSIGPIEISGLRSLHPFHVGWVGLKISGPGYLFPWTLRDVVDRIAESPEIQMLQAACRSHWPVTTANPDSQLVAARKHYLGELWPYDRFDLPNDWFWGLQES